MFRSPRLQDLRESSTQEDISEESVESGRPLCRMIRISAQEAKLFSTHLDRVSESYMPAKFVSVAKDGVSGIPDLDRASTSHVERKNGTLRQWCKRLTRLTYAFSKS